MKRRCKLEGRKLTLAGGAQLPVLRSFVYKKCHQRKVHALGAMTGERLDSCSALSEDKDMTVGQDGDEPWAGRLVQARALTRMEVEKTGLGGRT